MSKKELIIPQSKDESEKKDLTFRFPLRINLTLDSYIKILGNTRNNDDNDNNDDDNDSFIRIRASD